MSPTSAAGPDGMNGKFYQACWDIIKTDLLNVVLDFFGGSSMPKYMTNACIVMLPKVEFPNSLTEFRPISLSNFINKVISKVISSRLAPILPRVISDNQSSFVKGRNISENIICGFFQSSRGLKQGDPLAPSLFILGAELLSRMLNMLTNDQFFNGFYMQRRDPQINHLSFADDIIIFSSGSRSSLKRIMWILKTYEDISGKQINKSKSHFMTAACVRQSTVRKIHSLTGFTRKASPLTYLGCPLYIGRLRISHFNNLIAKVVGRTKGWHGKMLSYGGRATLIKYVLQSLPIHLLSAISPPKIVMKQIERLMANFFWGMEKDKLKYHWASWHKLSYPVNEGGIGFKSIAEVCKAMEFKQWWRFRTNDSLWSSFLKAKNCQRSHPIKRKWESRQSQAWKRMMYNKKDAEKAIIWRLHSGSSSFWWDKWLGDGPLALQRTTRGRPGKLTISYFWEGDQWNLQKLNEIAPPHKIPQIIQTTIHFSPNTPDKAIWKPTITGKFTCASAWELLRTKRQPNISNIMTWHKKIPFKWSFCLWRALRNKLPTDDRVLMFSNPTVSRCVCCSTYANETVENIFSLGNFARIVWKKYGSIAGIHTEDIPLRMLLMKW
ncbi:PREDICTED: uncharacterized protein LOC109243378 [Nicotiana attenuata]|uniref:uncharacterized protein LOC109243378 n=1 Tax=Nicotiana attenuata TaxID=49451 RepID=UPI0009056B71|nr:PREDICTED: uncharacterized protein LOC109243378 [Nicotiana attenuata]